jgi:hypothetical protein
LAKIKPADRKRAASSPGSPPAAAATETTSSELFVPQPPSPRVAAAITTAIMLHAALIAAAYLSVVRPSEVQGRILAGFAPYLAALHLAPESNAAESSTAEGVSFFLARGERSEQVHRLQFKSTTDRDEQGWVDAEFSGAAGSGRRRRQQRYLTAVANLGENDQNALVARLILPLIASHPDAQMVRVIRLPNLMTTTAQATEAAPYTAVILREQDQVRLVRVPAPRLGSASTVQEEPQS